MTGEQEDVAGDGSAPSQGSPTNKPKRKRGRGGCYTCRRRKKLCDNARPTCGSCQRLEIPCVFPKLYRNKDGTLAPSPQPNGRGRRLPSVNSTPDDAVDVPDDVADIPGEDSMAAEIDWNQINDSLGFPLGGLDAGPSAMVPPTMGMDNVLGSGGWNMDMPGFGFNAEAGPSRQPFVSNGDFTSNDTFMPNLGTSLPSLVHIDQAIPPALVPTSDQTTLPFTSMEQPAAAPSPQFDWWIPAPIGQPGHSVLPGTRPEDSPPQETTELTLVRSPKTRAPGLSGLSADTADNAPLLLDYFVNSFSKIISVLGAKEDLQLQHLLPLASASPFVMRGLVGWSAAHLAVLGEPFASIAKTNTKWIEEQLPTYDRPNIDPREREEAMMAMLMLGGAEVCEGNVKGWNSRLPTMRKLLTSATSSTMELSRDWRGMAFNAIYHDVLSAVATTRDMGLPVDMYQRILDTTAEPDTYMGIALQVFALLAEVATVAAKVSAVQRENDRISQLVRLHADGTGLLERLSCLEPPKACYVPEKMHMVFAFHAYRSAAELLVRQAIFRAGSTDIRSQILVERTLLHLRLVIDTPSESQMLFPLFVVGVDTIGADPRAEIVELFNRFNARVLTGNIKTAHALLQEVWSRNPDGDRWVDWRQVADDEGQAVSFG